MVNPMDLRNMQKMLKQMNTEQLEAEEVLIKLSDGATLSIRNPQVVKMEIMGQTTFQVVGTAVQVQEEKGPSEEDVKLVMEKSGAGRDEVDVALKESGGDIAEAILKFKK